MLQGWNPEDEASWDKAIAWRTLSITTFSMILAFAVWFLVSAIAPKLNDIGFNLTSGQLYWLAALPGLSGGAIRRRGRPGPAARRGAGPRPDRARIELETHPAAAANGRRPALTLNQLTRTTKKRGIRGEHGPS